MHGSTLRAAAKEAMKNQITDRAAAVTYYAFLAFPSALIVAVGVFALVGGESAIDSVISRADDVLPEEATTLVRDSLERTTQDNGVALIGVGGALALWTATGAMTAVMRALSAIHGKQDGRSFVRSRATALGMLAASLVAFLLVFGLLVLGPHLSDWVGNATGWESAVQWIWWVGQWPILGAGLLAVFATLLYLGPDVEHRRWVFITPGAVIALAIWLLASGGFSLYVTYLGSYSATWGALGAVVVMLTWLWLSTLALLFGAEIDSQRARRTNP